MKNQLSAGGFEESKKFNRNFRPNFDEDNRIEEDNLEENQSYPEKKIRKSFNSSMSEKLASELHNSSINFIP